MKKLHAAFIFLIAMFLTASAGAAETKKDREEHLDRDKDGRKETRVVYKDNRRVRMAVDKNGDGKEDQFTLFVKGRDVVLKEKDINFDGKVDWRSLLQWNPDKKITMMNGGRSQRIPMPGYDAVWKQIDNDFDGKIDIYREKGKKDVKGFIGKPIRPKATLNPLEAAS